MLLNFIDLLLLLLLTAYLGNQGVLSAMLTFISAAFAAILAGGFMDVLDGYVAAWWRPDYARGITFLVLFLVAFVICRLAADYAVPDNIKMPKTIDRSVGFLMGLLASLVVVGSLFLGIEMMPLPSTLLGFNRFPGDRGMQGDTPGVAAAPSNLWFAPDAFTVALCKLAAGRSMGGAQAFADVHPDLLTENYGYRQTVRAGANTAISPELVTVPTAWMSNKAEVLKPFGITDPGKAAVMVRAEISQSGDTNRMITNAGLDDAVQYFFITPSEVRLVTNKGHQYYPIGYLDKGTTFTPLPLDSGQLADDFPKSGTKLVEDWVFAINDDEKPQFIEIKQLARVSLAGIVKGDPQPALLADAYSPHHYKSQQGTVDVTVSGIDAEHLAGIKVYVIAAPTTKRDSAPLFHPAYQSLTAHLTQINNNEGLWSTVAGKPGVPDKGTFDQAHRMLQEFENKGPDDKMNWDEIIPYLFVGAAGADGPQNLITLPDYYKNTLVPAWQGPTIIKEGTTDASGKVELTEIPKALLDLVAAARSDKGFYVWCDPLKVTPQGTTNVTLSPSSAKFSVAIK